MLPIATNLALALHAAHTTTAHNHNLRNAHATPLAQATAEKPFAIAKPGSLSKAERMRSRYGIAFEPEDGWKQELEAYGDYAALESSMTEMVSYTRGETCTGTILGFEPNGAMVDIGVKSSAYVQASEASLEKLANIEEAFTLGESYEFIIVSREDENGQLQLSRRRILTDAAWEAASEACGADKAIEGSVLAVNRGGAIVSVCGLRAFLPGSHYLPGQNPPESLVGAPLTVKFLDVDRESNRLVVSHRKAMVDQTIQNLDVGAVMQGVVTAVKPYGAFVDLGGMSGLLHISQISCDHISDVGTVLPEGTVIKCMVISQDKGKGRVALSTKTLEVEAGDMLKNPQRVFDEAEATAVKYQERLEVERKAREEAAADVIFGLESVFDGPADDAAVADDDLPLPAPATDDTDADAPPPLEG